jgi:hypothetical protein
MWDLVSLGQQTILPIPAGATREVSLDWDPNSDWLLGGYMGAHFSTVVVDPDNAVVESDKSNNEVGRVLNILRDPNVMTLPKYIAFGDGILWTWVTYPTTTLGHGDFEVYNVEVEFHDGGPDGALLGRRIIPIMAHSEVVLVGIPVAHRPSGDVTVIVDPQNKIVEEHETDNIAMGPVRDQMPPAEVSQAN